MNPTTRYHLSFLQSQQVVADSFRVDLDDTHWSPRVEMALRNGNIKIEISGPLLLRINYAIMQARSYVVYSPPPKAAESLSPPVIKKSKTTTFSDIMVDDEEEIGFRGPTSSSARRRKTKKSFKEEDDGSSSVAAELSALKRSVSAISKKIKDSPAEHAKILEELKDLKGAVKDSVEVVQAAAARAPAVSQPRSHQASRGPQFAPSSATELDAMLGREFTGATDEELLAIKWWVWVEANTKLDIGRHCTIQAFALSHSF
mgnify:CR=1 FL=1